MSAACRKLGVPNAQHGGCGMAGSPGFEEDKYDVSMKRGERALFPAVRKAGLATLVVADGFSCREQIQQDTPRHAFHLAEVMQMALHDKDGASQMYPEHELVAKRSAAQRRSMQRAGIALAGVVAVGALLWWRTRSRA